MELHPMEQRFLRRFQIDMEQEAVRKDYVQLREIFAELGQIGPLPVPTLIEFVRRHRNVRQSESAVKPSSRK